MPIILGPSPPPGPGEGLIWSGTDLNDGTSYSLRAVDFTPPPKRPEWVQGADADGAALVRDPLFENRIVTVTLRVGPTGGLTMDSALAKVGALIDLCEESEKQQDGTALVWTPAQGTKSVTLYVLSAEISALPVDKDSQLSGWFRKAPTVTLKMTCKPFGYGAEVTVGASTASTPYLAYTVAGVTGDVPAEARLIVTDAASQNRRHLEWGLQQRYYDAATSLYVDSDNMVTTGFAGAGNTRTGADDPNAAGNNVIRTTLATTAVACCGTGNLGHVGTYHVKARVYYAPAGVNRSLYVRLAWKEGDGPLRANDWATASTLGSYALGGVAAFYELDLGMISIPEKQLGTQRWTGQIEAYASAAGDVLDVDYLLLFPADVYGKARARTSTTNFESITAFTARDEFDQTAGNLVGKTAPIGGNWAAATLAAATDFVVDATTHTAQRTLASGDGARGRIDVVGGSLTNVFIQADVMTSRSANDHSLGVTARVTDADNYLKLVMVGPGIGIANAVSVVKRVAGIETVLASVPFYPQSNIAYTLRLVIDAGGSFAAWAFAAGAQPGPAIIEGADAALATGGTLASGTAGLWDYAPGAIAATTRTYDNFILAVPSVDAAIFSGRSAEIRFDSSQRQDSTGTYYGPIQSYRGGRFYLPEAGSANRTTRLLVKARRNDVDVSPDDQVADSTTVQVKYTPRFLAIPR